MSKQNIQSEPIVKIQDIEEKQKTARERRQERRRAMQERAEKRKAERDEVSCRRTKRDCKNERFFLNCDEAHKTPPIRKTIVDVFLSNSSYIFKYILYAIDINP